MNPNSPEPTQTPTPEPTVPPAEAQQFQAPPAPQQFQASTPIPTPGGQPPKKKLSTGAIIGIIGATIIVTLLIIGAAFAIATSILPKTNDVVTESSQDSAPAVSERSDDVSVAGNSHIQNIIATGAVQVRAACVGGSVQNAGVFKKPYSYAIFENNNKGIEADERIEWGWDTYTYGTDDETVNVDELNGKSDPSAINVTVCLERDISNAIKATTCTLLRSPSQSPGDSTVADYYSAQYKMTLYEAQSGKKIKDYGTVNAPATECPVGVSYDPKSPAIYADPDFDEVAAKLDTFAKE